MIFGCAHLNQCRLCYTIGIILNNRTTKWLDYLHVAMMIYSMSHTQLVNNRTSPFQSHQLWAAGNPLPHPTVGLSSRRCSLAAAIRPSRISFAVGL